MKAGFNFQRREVKVPFRPKKEEREKAPTADDFTGRAIGLHVLGQTTTHLATTVPAAVSIVGGMWLGVIGPDPVAALALAGGATLAAAAWVINYFFRGETFAERHVADLRKRRELAKRSESHSLRQRFQEVDFLQGENAASELQQAYYKLVEFLSERAQSGRSLGAERYLVLAEDTYEYGLQILEKVLAIYQALQQIDVRKLENEAGLWHDTLTKLAKKTEASEAEINALRIRLKSHEDRISRYRNREREMHHLLAECEKLEGALEGSHLDLLDLSISSQVLFAKDAPSRLETAIRAAQKVEEKLRGLNVDGEEDDFYREAGSKALNNQPEEE